MEFLDAVLPIEQGGAFQRPLPSKFGSLAMFARDAACLILGDFSCAPRNRGIGNDVLASGIGVG